MLSFRLIPVQEYQPAVLKQGVSALSGLSSAGLGKCIPCVWFETMRLKNNFCFLKLLVVETDLRIENW